MARELIDERPAAGLTRRDVLDAARFGAITTAAGSLVSSTAPVSAEPIAEMLRHLTGDKTPAESDSIRLDLPAAFRFGDSVPLTVTAESPMTDGDYVRQVHIMAPGNPFPEVASFHFTPDSGRASVSTRIRLEAGHQAVLAAAELSDGSVVMTSNLVEITIGGCHG